MYKQPSTLCSISTFRPGESEDLAMANVDVDWAGAADAQEKVSFYIQSIGNVENT